MLPKSLWQTSSILSSFVIILLTINKIFCVLEAYLASCELIFLISAMSLALSLILILLNPTLTSSLSLLLSSLLILLSFTMKVELISERYAESLLVILVLKIFSISTIILLEIIYDFSINFILNFDDFCSNKHIIFYI